MTRQAAPVIAIDGPTASGKGTVAQRVAVALGWHYLDSGAIYRLAALAALEGAVALDDEPALAQRAAGLPIDMASVVFPDAALKVFLTASAESRAERRYKQLIEKGFSANLDGLLRDLRARDARDAGRTHAPLIAAEGAVVVDSTFLSVEQTVQTVLDGWHAAGLARSRAASGS